MGTYYDIVTISSNNNRPYIAELNECFGVCPIFMWVVCKSKTITYHKTQTIFDIGIVYETFPFCLLSNLISRKVIIGTVQYNTN